MLDRHHETNIEKYVTGGGRDHATRWVVTIRVGSGDRSLAAEACILWRLPVRTGLRGERGVVNPHGTCHAPRPENDGVIARISRMCMYFTNRVSVKVRTPNGVLIWKSRGVRAIDFI